MRISRSISCAVLYCALNGLLQGATLDVESAKRVLEDKWMALTPTRVAERKVLFQQVQAAGQSADGSVFIVTAWLWDMGKGNPRFRDWGETCISKFTAQRYTLAARAGNWEIFGPMVEAGNCKSNPAEGVSGIPLASLPGAPAGKGQAAAAPALVRVGGVGQGAYECWSFGSPRPLLNLKIQAGNRYVDSEGGTGSFSVTPGTGRMTFKGGNWDGGLPPDSSVVYYEPKGIPVISIRDTKNNEFAYCEAK